MRLVKWLLALAALALLAALVYRIPAVERRLSWRLDAARTALRFALDPLEAAPTPLPLPTSTPAGGQPPEAASALATPTPTSPGPSPTPPPSPTPIPASASLDSPEWERQDWNNCGPATMSMYLRYWGWEGDQFSVSDVLKPERADRNVNVEELVHYAGNYAGWLRSEFRVGGDIELLKGFIAAGIPVMVEEGFHFDEPFWRNDDLWAGHYLLLTAYDDAAGTFTAQDSFRGADLQVPYERLDEGWKAFNRVYLLLYPPEREAQVQEMLGPHWDVEYNRQGALEAAQAEAEADPEDAFAWFSVGTNLVYFERYTEAALAYDQARQIGLPQRMFRYQFGPFFAYFHSGRTDDLLALTEYALQITDNSEEALVWHGWGLFRQGDLNGAVADFRAAYEANPLSADAQYALEYVGATP